MASLVEELVTVLEEEEKIYQTLISYGETKTDILIRADVPELEKLTCLEQLASDDLVTHSNQHPIPLLLADRRICMAQTGHGYCRRIGSRPDPKHIIANRKFCIRNLISFHQSFPILLHPSYP